MNAAAGGSPPGRTRQSLRSASAATAIALSILVALGCWQISRLHWKEGLLRQIAAADKAGPVLLTGDTPPLFTRVSARGVFKDGPVALYGADVEGNHLGAQLLEILEREGAPPLLVVLGWVATDQGSIKRVTGPAEITGYVRLPEQPGWLSAADDLEGRHFYTLNPTTIGASLGAANAAPLTLIALRPAGQGTRLGVPQAAAALPQPVNNHLQYAFTWFGLAGALLAVYLSWAWRRPA